MSKQDQSAKPPPLPLTKRQKNNVITDTILGPNLRRKDNLYQGVAIAACTVLGAVIGALAAGDWRGGLLVGAIVGMIAGLFSSGIFLMIYRGMKHSRGEHD